LYYSDADKPKKTTKSLGRKKVNLNNNQTANLLNKSRFTGR
jgi:hypothetical protein